LEFLSEQLGVDIIVGGGVPAGLMSDPLDEPITLSVRHTQLTGRSALQLVLDQVRNGPSPLSYIVRDGIVHVRWSAADSALTVSMMDVRTLLSEDPSGEQLITAVQQMVLPESWKETGGMTGSVSVFNGLLLVRHTPEGITEVKRFVEQLTDASKELDRAGSGM
jgi:hypothetical protein